MLLKRVYDSQFPRKRRGQHYRLQHRTLPGVVLSGRRELGARSFTVVHTPRMAEAGEVGLRLPGAQGLSLVVWDDYDKYGLGCESHPDKGGGLVCELWIDWLVFEKCNPQRRTIPKVVVEGGEEQGDRQGAKAR